MSFVEERILYPPFLDRLISADEAAALFKDGMTVCFPDFGFMDNPRDICAAVTRRVTEKGETLRLNVIKCANAHPEIEQQWAENGIMKRRMVFYSDSTVRQLVNTPGGIEFRDPHLSHVPDKMRAGVYGKLDMVVVSCCGVTETGKLLPSFDQGYTPVALECAEKVLLEISMDSIEGLYKLHDVYSRRRPASDGGRTPIPLTDICQHIGGHYYDVAPEKVAGIVISSNPMNVYPMWNVSAPSPEVSTIAEHFVSFICNEVSAGRLPENLLPLQTGAGAVADVVIRKLGDRFQGLTMYTEGIMDGGLELLLDGRITKVSTGGWSVNERFAQILRNNIDELVGKVVIRPTEVSNSAEIINRLGVIAMNNALEADIYGNVNSTNAIGSRMISGIGGSGDYARNAYLTVFFTLSTAKGGKISSVVPFCSHIDHTEHDVDIIITEYGVADLRDKSPRERAKEMIRISHPDYRPLLQDYYDRAVLECSLGRGHTPHILSEALSWHDRYIKTGTMKLEA